MNFSELKQFLDEKVELYNTPDFIESDPISIPHQFDLKEDIEIMGFLVSNIAWGNISNNNTAIGTSTTNITSNTTTITNTRLILPLSVPTLQ